MDEYIPRHLEQHLKQLAEWFPIVSIAGPRQSGKSTLIRKAFPAFGYVNLEDPTARKAAEEDPIGFLHQHSAPLIIDEAQRVPDLFSAIQVISDQKGTTGQYVLSGSQNFLMLRRIGQSLAGRVGLTTLLPFSFQECVQAKPEYSPEEFAWTGGYPRLIKAGMPPSIFYASYIDTYVQRDVSGELDVRNLAAFRTFLLLCAQRAGGILNVSKLASQVGVSFQTAKSWLSILQASFIVYLLPSYAANEGKRLIKAPKLYWYDTGLLCHLLRIGSVEALVASEHFGVIIENLVVAETLKAHLHSGKQPELYYYRDDSKREVDLIDVTVPDKQVMLEVKSGETYKDKFALHLSKVGGELGFSENQRLVVYRGSELFATKQCQVVPLQYFLETK